MIFLAADTSVVNWLTPLAQLGGIGGVLIWFMIRNEPRLLSIEAAVDRITRAIIILTLALPDSTQKVKNQAQAINDELDEAAKLRKNQ